MHGLVTDQSALRPEPGEHVRRQLADADKALDAGNAVHLDQLQFARCLFKTGQGADQEQLVIGICLTPQHAVFGAGQGFEVVVFIVDTARCIRLIDGKGLADKGTAHRTKCRAGQITHRTHAQRVAEHVEPALEPRHLQAMGDVIAAAPVGGARFIAGCKVGMAGGEVNGVDMGLELGPTAETQLFGHLPLGLGQCGSRVLAFQVPQQFLGALALLLKVETAIGVGR